VFLQSFTSVPCNEIDLTISDGLYWGSEAHLKLPGQMTWRASPPLATIDCLNISSVGLPNKAASLIRLMGVKRRKYRPTIKTNGTKKANQTTKVAGLLSYRLAVQTHRIVCRRQVTVVIYLPLTELPIKVILRGTCFFSCTPDCSSRRSKALSWPNCRIGRRSNIQQNIQSKINDNHAQHRDNRWVQNYCENDSENKNL